MQQGKGQLRPEGDVLLTEGQDPPWMECGAHFFRSEASLFAELWALARVSAQQHMANLRPQALMHQESS